MNPEVSLLPEGFESLEPFVEKWAIVGSGNRVERRIGSTESERAQFHAAATVKWGDALNYLDQKPLDQLDEKEQRLMNLMLSFAHISFAVEVQKEQEPAHALGQRHFHITRSVSNSLGS